MANLAQRFTQVLVFTGVLAVSGILIGASPSDPAHVKQLIETRSCANCDLTEANLVGSFLPKSDLSGANLSGANLYTANLAEANLSSANLVNTDLRAANLRGATGAVLGSAKTDARTTCPDGFAGPCK